MHGGFVVGLAVLGLWFGQKIFIAIKQKSKPLAFWPSALALAAVSATFLTPYGWRLYDFFLTYRNDAYLKHISEWKSIWIFPVHYWQLVAIATLAALAIILLIFKHFTKVPIWLWLASLIFLIMGIKSVRHFPLFFVVASLTILPEFIAVNFSAREREPSKLIFLSFIKILLPLVLFVSSWLVLLTTNFFYDPFQKNCNDYPCQVGRMLKLHPRYSQLKLLNKYDYGGWLIWVWPEKKLFIDGRLPQYPLGRWSLLEEYLEFYQVDKIAEKLKTYDIEAVLWSNHLPQYHLSWLDKLMGFKEAEINGRSDELKKYLDNSDNWLRAFSDDASTVYIRKDKY